MGDSVSMIFFTVSDEYTQNLHTAPRITREIFCYKDNVLLQSRLYPTDLEDQKTLYRSIVQQAIATCLDKPNLWSIKRGKEAEPYGESATDSNHYPDYKYGYAVASLLKGETDYIPMTIGSVARCVCCGGEQKSEKTSMRTRDRIRQIVSSGHFAGGFVPYGYRAINKGRVNKRDQPVKDLEINPDEAAWVREVFTKVAEEGASGYAMAQMLNQRGLRTRQGAEFQSSNIKRIIQHEGYTGYIITKAARSEFMPQLQIIDEALFAKANEMIGKRSRKAQKDKKAAQKSGNPTLLAGIVVCAHCGAKMSAFLHTDRYKLADGSVREKVQAKYNCYQRGQHLRECDGQALYLAERVDRIVVAYADELFRKIKSEPYDKCSWFMMEEANYRNDQALHATAQQIFRNAIEAGWDEEYGGLLYFIDCLGKPTEAYEHDMKLWWPHNEILIASLMAYRDTKDPYYLNWFEKTWSTAKRILRMRNTANGTDICGGTESRPCLRPREVPSKVRSTCLAACRWRTNCWAIFCRSESKGPLSNEKPLSSYSRCSYGPVPPVFDWLVSPKWHS